MSIPPDPSVAVASQDLSDALRRFDAESEKIRAEFGLVALAIIWRLRLALLNSPRHTSDFGAAREGVKG